MSRRTTMSRRKVKKWRAGRRSRLCNTLSTSYWGGWALGQTLTHGWQPLPASDPTRPATNHIDHYLLVEARSPDRISANALSVLRTDGLDGVCCPASKSRNVIVIDAQKKTLRYEIKTPGFDLCKKVSRYMADAKGQVIMRKQLSARCGGSSNVGGSR